VTGGGVVTGGGSEPVCGDVGADEPPPPHPVNNAATAQATGMLFMSL